MRDLSVIIKGLRPGRQEEQQLGKVPRSKKPDLESTVSMLGPAALLRPRTGGIDMSPVKHGSLTFEVCLG